MATISLRRISNSETGAENAVMDIAGDIANVDGVKTNITVVEDSKTGNFLAEMTIVIPPEVELDEVQKEKLERFTDLDEKEKELADDFVAVENPDQGNEPNEDPVLESLEESVEDDLASAATFSINQQDVTDDNLVHNKDVPKNNSNEDDEIIISKDDIGEMIPDPAPEADAEFGVGLTAEAVDAREARWEEKEARENQAANSPKEPSNKKKQTPGDEFEPAA